VYKRFSNQELFEMKNELMEEMVNLIPTDPSTIKDPLFQLGYIASIKMSIRKIEEELEGR
jgi:hypothetical protein